ncbi:hypothetical protein QTP88_010198 [Uroleucon formosanum]
MPKNKTSTSARLRTFVSEFRSDIFSTDGYILFCKICDVKVAADKKFTVEQHVSRQKHINGIDRKNLQTEKSKNQSLLTQPSRKCTFNYDLCQALLSANIPLNKLSNDCFRNFLEKYTNNNIPVESTLRKSYVAQCYEETINNIKKYCENQKLWISIDETTDVEGRYIANVIIGTLEIGCPGKIFLLNTEALEKANYTSIAKLLDKALHLLWPQVIKYDNILLFLSDAAPYMVKAGKGIKIIYSKMEHVTCLAHGLHRVAEEVRKYFTKVDQLTSNVKKNFLKCPARIQFFREKAPNISLPPQPVLTRWGTWLSAANYYCEHYETLKEIILGLNREDSISIEKAQDLMEDCDLKSDLIYIYSNFGTLSNSITKLETFGLSLQHSIKIVQKVVCKCSYECKRLTIERIKTTRKKFATLSYKQQADYLLSRLTIVSIQRRRKSKKEIPDSSRRQCSVKYTVPGDQDLIQVCKRTFMRLFSLSNSRLQLLIEYVKKGEISFVSQSGKNPKSHEHRRKYGEEIVDIEDGDIFDLNLLAKQFLNTTKMGISNVTGIKVTMQSLFKGSVSIKRTYGEIENWTETKVAKRGVNLKNIPTVLPKVKTNHIIDEKKAEDLLRMLEFMDPKYRDFYTELCSQR